MADEIDLDGNPKGIVEEKSIFSDKGDEDNSADSDEAKQDDGSENND